MKSFIVEQKITAFANQYRIYGTTSEGDKGQLVAFAHQKRLAFKEKIEFFADEARQDKAFEVKAEKVMDIHGKFIVSGAPGVGVRSIRKAFRQSLLRSTWEILDENDEVITTVTERSQFFAILRRGWGFVPFIGELPLFFKYHFDFLKQGTDEVVGSYSKTTLLRDHYRLDVEDSLYETVGSQALIAQAVLLDALQGR